MKITSSQLRRLIQEESRRILREQGEVPPELLASFRESLVTMEQVLEDLKDLIRQMRVPGSILSKAMANNLEIGSPIDKLLGNISEQLDMIDTSTP